MLTSLKTFKITGSSITFLPLARSDVKWQLPVTHLVIASWSGSAKELTRLLCHLPVLSILVIYGCHKITRLGVEAEQKQMASSLSMPASSVVKLQDTHGTGALEVEEDVVAEEVVAEQQQEEDDGLLLLPAHLSGSLREFRMMYCSKLILTVQNGGAGGGGLQFMHSLESLEILQCLKFLSAYKASGLSYCPFPSSLQRLELWYTPLVPLWNLTSLQELIITTRSWGEDLRWMGDLSLLTHGQLTKLKVHHSSNFFAGWEPAQALQDGQEQPSSKLQQLETNDVAGVLALPICRLISSSLTKLSIVVNEEVERFTKEQEEALSFLTSLQELRFWWCRKLRCLPSGLHKLTSLKGLWIWECPAIRSLPKNGLPSSLQELRVDYCIQLRCLPAGLHKLTNLKRLEIRSCPAIGSLPKYGLPCSLTLLDVSNCENEKLKQRCRRLVGTSPQIRL
jgi:Leucine-rich repeat (LRR) protein